MAQTLLLLMECRGFAPKAGILRAILNLAGVTSMGDDTLSAHRANIPSWLNEILTTIAPQQPNFQESMTTARHDLIVFQSRLAWLQGLVYAAGRILGVFSIFTTTNMLAALVKYGSSSRIRRLDCEDGPSSTPRLRSS